MTRFINSKEASEVFGVSDSTLKKWRNGHRNTPALLTEGVHFVKTAQTYVLWNVALVEDFFVNRSNPDAHQRAIDAYLGSLPSSQC